MQFLILVASAAVAFQPTPTTQRHTTKLFEKPREGPGISVPRNVLGGDLECCCADVRGSGIGTGFYRDGHCSTGQDDEGRHTVCIEATEDFLDFSASVGNDLSTPNPQSDAVRESRLRAGTTRGTTSRRWRGLTRSLVRAGGCSPA